MITFNCGHDNDTELAFLGHAISLAEYDRTNERCVTNTTVCRRCLVMYQTTGDILHTEHEIENWLKGDK